MNTQTYLTILAVVLAIILVLGIVLSIVFYSEYHNIKTKESPLCLTGSCQYTSQGCGTYPFKVQQDGSLLCNPSIFTKTTPGVSVGSNG
jgi:hypothetical protein